MKITKAVNFKPSYVPIKRYLRLAAFIVCAAAAVNIYAIANNLIAFSAIKEAGNSPVEARAAMLQGELDSIKSEREKCAELITLIIENKSGVQLDGILTAANEYRADGIRIYSIETNSISGYGTSLESVTRFMKRLSSLGIELDVKNIVQLEISETVTGFEFIY